MSELEKIRRQADSFIPHARGCKKDLADCKQCAAAVAFYADLRLCDLALVLQDRPTLKSTR